MAEMDQSDEELDELRAIALHAEQTDEEVARAHEESLEQFYMTVYSITHSYCNRFLAAGNSYGMIAIYDLTPFFDWADETAIPDDQMLPFFKFSAHQGCIYSLESTKELIISGSVGEISAWKWSDIKNKENRPVWTYVFPHGQNLYTPEVNGLAVPKDNDGIFYAGGGDKKVYCFNAETGTVKLIFEGHEDFIISMACGGDWRECTSGSEDGSVRVWDARKGGEATVIEPFKHEMPARPLIGKWIGCVAYNENEDWLVCGGAPNLGLWDMRSLSPFACLPKRDATSNVACFYEDMVLSGGNEPCFNHWAFDGSLIAEIPSLSSCIYDMDITQRHTRQLFFNSGTSDEIGLCMDFRYQDFLLKFA